MDNVEEKTARIRIPGLAGIFKDDPTQEYIRKRSFDDIEGGCFSDIESYLKKGKLEIVVAIITSCKPNVLGDMNVTLKDPSGTTSGIIHYKVLSSEDGYAKDIKVGSTFDLSQNTDTLRSIKAFNTS
ncbi:copia protein [Tanacetum coccineum]